MRTSGHENELSADNPERCTANELQTSSQFDWSTISEIGRLPTGLGTFQGRASRKEESGGANKFKLKNRSRNSEVYLLSVALVSDPNI